MRDRITVLLVDDHPVVREGLQTMLSSESDINVVDQASTGEEALQKVELLEPRVVLMDIRMPAMGGIEATRQIKKVCPQTSVIILSIYDDEVYVIQAIRAGASGYLTKDSSKELLCHSVRAVLDGGILLRSGLLRKAFYESRTAIDSGDQAASSLLGRLTPRELDVLRLLAQGGNNKAISAELHLAEITVKKHIKNLIGKLGASDRTHAAVVGVRLGIVD